MEKKPRLKLKKIDVRQFTIRQTVGTGSFGRVKLVQSTVDGKFYALKCLKKAEIIKNKQVDHLISEVNILNEIEHPFIVRFYGFAQNDRVLQLLMDYVPGGELFSHIRTCQQLGNDEARFFAAQVVLIFEYLHGRDIIYRDLKPENLLLDAQGYLKLTDFGFAKEIHARTYTLCGTPEYLAPEILLHKGHSKPVDWWCLGILIYEMLVGIDPFSDDDPMAVYQNILRGKIKFPGAFNIDAKSLVKKLLVADLAKRCGNLVNGVNDIKDHRWFKTMDWAALLRKSVRPRFIPRVKEEGDTSNFADYPDSPEQPKGLAPHEDPFSKW